jgi:hypothetical protein
LRVQETPAASRTKAGKSGCDQEWKREDPRDGLDGASQWAQEHVGARERGQEPANSEEHDGSNDQAETTKEGRSDLRELRSFVAARRAP